MPPRMTARTVTRFTILHRRWHRNTIPRRCRNWRCASSPERAIHQVRGTSTMNFRRLAMALGIVAIVAQASAQTPDLTALARMSGTPEFPGLKMVWLAPWGEVSKAHPWRNIIVHQTEGPAGSAGGGAPRQTQ